MHSVSRFICVVRLVVSVRYPTTNLPTEANIALALFNRRVLYIQVLQVIQTVLTLFQTKVFGQKFDPNVRLNIQFLVSTLFVNIVQAYSPLPFYNLECCFVCNE